MTALSLPLDAGELYYTLWALPGRDLFSQWLAGNPGYPVHCFGSCSILSRRPDSFGSPSTGSKRTAEPFLTRTFQALVALAALIAVVGLLFLFQWIPRGRSYLSLSLVGVHEGAISAFAFNRQFLAQYLLLCLPLAAYLAQRYARRRNFTGLIPDRGRPGPFLPGLGSQHATIRLSGLVPADRFFSLGDRGFIRLPQYQTRLLWLTPLLIAAGLFLLDWTVLDQRFIRRLHYLNRLRGYPSSTLAHGLGNVFLFSLFGGRPGTLLHFFP